VWGESGQLEGLEKKFGTALRTLRSERNESLDKLDAGFERALDRIEKSAKEAGNLDLLVELKKIRESFDQGGKLPDSRNPELKKNLDTLSAHADKVNLKYGTGVNQLIDGYIERLGKVLDAYTKAGKVEEALEVRKAIKAVEFRRIKDLPEPAPAVEEEKDAVADELQEGDTAWEIPGSRKKLHDYLTNTVWTVNGGYFRFRGDGTMTMPWHDFKWEAKEKNEVKMYTSVWHFRIVFGEDAKTFKVTNSKYTKEKWAGSFTRRHPLSSDKGKIQSILTRTSWRRDLSPGKGEFNFSSTGKIKNTFGVQSWEEWENVDGLIRLKGKEEGKTIRLDVAVVGDKPPYKLVRIGKEFREVQFLQE